MFINSREFVLKDRDLVKRNDHGFTFVFFFTPDCVYCDDVKPAFIHLSKVIKGCNFFFCDVSDGYLPAISAQSKTPITYVPFVLLFANGQIIGQFFPDEDNPANNTARMSAFIKTTTDQYVQRISGAGSKQTPEPEPDRPPYAFGIPYNRSSRRVCKLYSDAYTQPATRR
jgi:thiol-disulfide isomerase/thioredoxin